MNPPISDRSDVGYANKQKRVIDKRKMQTFR